MPPVRYHCPRCETVVVVDRKGYLADKCVTPFPLEGWTYVAPEAHVDTEANGESADGIRFVCGESPAAEWRGEGCGEPFSLSFDRFDDGQEVEPTPESEYVTLASDGPSPRRGPDGPPGPG